jgi:hypothetical protein
MAALTSPRKLGVPGEQLALGFPAGKPQVSAGSGVGTGVGAAVGPGLGVGEEAGVGVGPGVGAAVGEVAGTGEGSGRMITPSFLFGGVGRFSVIVVHATSRIPPKLRIAHAKPARSPFAIRASRREMT